MMNLKINNPNQNKKIAMMTTILIKNKLMKTLNYNKKI